MRIKAACLALQHRSVGIDLKELRESAAEMFEILPRD